MIERIIKILNDGNITLEIIRREFSEAERTAIVTSSETECAYMRNECSKRGIPLLNKDEAWETAIYYAEALLDETTLVRLGSYMTQEQLKEYVMRFGFTSMATKLHDANMIAEIMDYGSRVPKSYRLEMVTRMDNDEIKLQYMKKYLKRKEYGEVILSLENDDLKVANLKLCGIRELPEVIASIKNDALKEKYIMRLPFGKGEIIASLKSDTLKERYFNKCFTLLSADDKGKILASFKDYAYIDKYQERLKSGRSIISFTSFVVSSPHRTKVKEQLLGTLVGRITKEKDAMDMLNIVDNLDYRKELLKRIHSDKAIREVITCSLHQQFDASILLDKANRATREFIVGDIGRNYPEIAFGFLNKLSSVDSIIKVISDFEKFPMYNTDYEFIVDKCCDKYKLNKDHFLALLNVVGCALFVRLSNKNIIDAINLSEDDFQKYLKIINNKNATVTESIQNDILNALIQRQFRIDEKPTCEIFSRILDDVVEAKLDYVYSLLDEMSKWVNYEDYGTSVEKLFKQLKETRSKEVLDTLQSITSKYIMLKRNEYLADHIVPSMEKCCDVRYEKNGYAAYILRRTPVDDIVDKVSNITDGIRYNQEEMSLVKDKELLTKLIKFKKNPRESEPLTLDEKKCLPILINIIDKQYNGLINYRYGVPVCKNYLVKENESLDLVSVMESLNIKQIKDTLFNNEELLEELLKVLDQYRLIGWGKKYESVALGADVSCDAFIIASLINNYKGITARKRRETNNDKEKSQMTLTEMLDRASVYDSVSYRYSILMGKDNLFYLKTNPMPYRGNLTFEERLKIAVKLIPKMYERETIPVPGMDETIKVGEKELNVELGNVADLINLTLGERTGSCMRIGGAASNLHEFCAVNSKGFHVVLYDPKTNDMVSRISCFRNGNTVYMNQLRHSVSPKYNDDDLIAAVKMIAKKIVEQTKDSESPVQNVFINYRYGMERSNMPVIQLEESEIDQGIQNVYLDLYDGVILLATDNPKGVMTAIDTTQKPVAYEPLRGKKKVLYDKKAQEEVAHFQLLDAVLKGRSIDSREIVLNRNIKVCVSCEDWYVAVDNQGKVEQFILANTKRRDEALKEIQEALEEIKNNVELSEEKGRKLA